MQLAAAPRVAISGCRVAAAPLCPRAALAAAAARPPTAAPLLPARRGGVPRRQHQGRGRTRGPAPLRALLSTEQLVGLAIFFSPTVAALIYAFIKASEWGSGLVDRGLRGLARSSVTSQHPAAPPLTRLQGKGNLTDGLSRLLTEVSQVGAAEQVVPRARGCCSGELRVSGLKLVLPPPLLP